jgi:C4-dicarboxylate-specific signal transduction histidine kinase
VIDAKAKITRSRIDKGKADLSQIKNDMLRIEDTAERIGKIVSGLRTFTRDAKMDPLEPARLDKIVEDTLALCQEKFSRTATSLSVTQLPGTEISCRPSQIAQVLLNLLGNACDAIAEQEEKWVRLECAVAEGKVQISITDSGKGIPPAVVNQMMNPFFTTKPVGKGTGLGLSISKGIVEEHGGSLRYDPSSPNTRFVLEFPLAGALIAAEDLAA